MKGIISAMENLTSQTLALMKAETEIRRACKNAWTKQKTKASLTEEIRRIISHALRSVRLKELAVVASYSLWRFYDRQWREYSRLQGVKGMAWLYLLTLGDEARKSKTTGLDKRQARNGLKALGYNVSGGEAPLINGVPMRMYEKRYFEKYVKPTFERLLADEPRDPHDISGRNTLRNRAEMEVRYNGHLEQIYELKQNGEKLVIASTHSDCSDRCRPWQGRVYSLDGSYGVTDDGRRYIPLETATDVFYTTKAGKTYKNGLLGFNCRHYLEPYQTGLTFPSWSRATEKREYNITKGKRYLERGIRKWKYRADMFDGQSEEEYKKAVRKIDVWERRYSDFCRKHNRAEDKTRTLIL